MPMEGQIIGGKYKVLRRLGKGGFGTVYLVEITAGMVGERLALKLLSRKLSDNEKSREHFLNEIRVAMHLVDRHIIQLRDVGVTDEGQLYYTMDYSPGVTLKSILEKEKRLACDRSVRLALCVLRGLRTAHEQGVIHRDLKPANLMVEGDYDHETVRILDFGIATAVGATGTAQRGKFAGSFHYTPPEQLLGHDLGFYTDVYALGVILYQCLTGARPYRGKSPREIYEDMKSRAVVAPIELNHDLERFPGLNDVVVKALQRNPDLRYRDASSFARDLEAVLAPPSAGPAAPRAAGRPSAPAAARSAAVRRSVSSGVPALGIGTVAACVAAVALAIVGILYFGRDDPPPPLPEPVTPSSTGGPTDSSDGGSTSGGASAGDRGSSTAGDTSRETVALEEDRVGKARSRHEDLIQRATELRDEGRVEAAVVLCERAVSLSCDIVELREACYRAHRMKGFLQLELGQEAVALAALEQALAMMPGYETDPELHVAVARARWSAGRKDEAIALLRDFTSSRVVDRRVLLALLELLESENRAAELAEVLEETRSAFDTLLEGDELKRALELHERFVVVPRREEEERLRRESDEKRRQDLVAFREAYDRGDWAKAVELGATHFADRPEVDLGLKLSVSHSALGQFNESLTVLARSARETEPEGPALFDLRLEQTRVLLEQYENDLGSRRTSRYGHNVREAGKQIQLALASIDAGLEVDRNKHALALSLRARCAAHEAKRPRMEADIDEANRILRRPGNELVFHQGKSYFVLARKTRYEPSLTAAITRLNLFTRLHKEKDALLGEAYAMQGLCYYYLKRRRQDLINARNKFIEAQKLGFESKEMKDAWVDCDIRLK